jgi:hypothetical protein
VTAIEKGNDRDDHNRKQCNSMNISDFPEEETFLVDHQLAIELCGVWQCLVFVGRCSGDILSMTMSEGLLISPEESNMVDWLSRIHIQPIELGIETQDTH